VEITDAAEASDQTADALRSTAPAGPSPTWPALVGSLQYAMEWEPRDDALKVVVLIVAGAPADCTGEASLVEAVAMVQGSSNRDPHVLTNVIGLEPEFDLDPIARAADTLPIRLESSDATERLSQALLRAAVGMLAQPTALRAYDVQIPTPTDGHTVDLNSGLMTAIVPWGGWELIPRVDSAADCASSEHGGWYYDPPEAPTHADLCECTRIHLGCPQPLEARWACLPETLED
jgi:hypothetical protein